MIVQIPLIKLRQMRKCRTVRDRDGILVDVQDVALARGARAYRC